MKTKEDFEFQNNLSWMIDWLEVHCFNDSQINIRSC